MLPNQVHLRSTCLSTFRIRHGSARIAAWVLVFFCSPVMSVAQTPEFTMTADDATASYDPVTGVGSGSVSTHIQENAPTPGSPTQVSGWSYGLSYDPSVMTVTSIDQGAYVASFDGGLGPSFWATQIYADGVTIETVYDFLGFVICTYEVQKEVAILNYETVPATLAGDVDGEDVTFDFTGVFGTPPVLPVVHPATSMTVVPTTVAGVIHWEPTLSFRRGDCNRDGSTNLSDPISMVTILFGTIAPGPTCLDACDANDDGVYNIADVIAVLSSLFGAPSTPLPPPTGSCGQDPTPDALDCEFYSSC